MGALPYGPIREIVITCPVHLRCIGELLEEAAEVVYRRTTCCLHCIPNQITLAAWHIYWARGGT